MFLTLAAVTGAPWSLPAQGFLDEFSYESLRLSGIGLELGWIASDRVTSELTGGARVDYGLIAPDVRLMFGLTYFKAEFDADEIAEFESQLQGVVTDPTGDFTIDVGRITLFSVTADIDLQYLFRTSSRLTPYVGAGLGIHVRSADGQSINGTFVEDALDTVAAGVNLMAGGNLRLAGRLSLYADSRIALTSELNSLSLRGGFMYHLPTGSDR